MENMYIAVDIGATSGRVLVEHSNGILKEVHRFPNTMEANFWDLETLFNEVVQGLQMCNPNINQKVSLSIDTWGCDYILLDDKGKPLGPSQSYRNPETNEAVSKVQKVIGNEALYKRTGIQYQPFNTIYQLIRDQETGRLDNAETLLFIPDYLNYLLTGEKYSEMTVSSTSQLMNLEKKDWDRELIDKLGIPMHLFQEIIKPGKVIGNLTKNNREIIGFDIEVIACASHDTASAFKVAASKDELILSSGTWSLLGVHLDEPIYTIDAQKLNFTNELAYDGNIRFLKNIIGLWIVNELKNEIYPNLTFDELISLVTLNGKNDLVVDVNDGSLLSPSSMKMAIEVLINKKYPTQKCTNEQLFYCVFNSLAYSYKETIEEIENLTKKKYSILNVVGGGSKNSLLNSLIEQFTNVKVIIGHTESTGMGNIFAQKEARGRENGLQ